MDAAAASQMLSPSTLCPKGIDPRSSTTGAMAMRAVYKSSPKKFCSSQS